MNAKKKCSYPERKTCRGCEHSYNPALYDGGCKIMFPQKKTDDTKRKD